VTTSAAEHDRLSRWCGWVWLGMAVLTPPVAWLWPLGFPLIVSVAGALTLPALALADRDRPLAALLSLGVVWAAVSTVWSPWHPKHADETTALKLAFQLPLYWAAWCGARRAEPRLRARAAVILAWGLAALGLMMIADGLAGGAIYSALRDAVGEPIRADLARKNLAHASFVLALLWPVATAAGVRGGAPAWLAVPMAAGAGLLAWLFLSDAPVLSLGLVAIVGVAAWRWPTGAPRTLAALAVVQILAMPVIVAVMRAGGLDFRGQQSWADRVGYWTHALQWIEQHPLRGWGLDASRAFGPGIQLHPHDAALQLWLELGLPGALLGAGVWALVLSRLARSSRDLVAVGALASAAVYALFGAVNFGIWQEWWLALAALVAAVACLGERSTEAAPSGRSPVPNVGRGTDR
jgi:O-antigen ligase